MNEFYLWVMEFILFTWKYAWIITVEWCNLQCSKKSFMKRVKDPWDKTNQFFSTYSRSFLTMEKKSPDNRELNWNLRKFLLEFRIFFTEKCGSRSIVAVSRLVDRSHANGQPYVKVRGLSWQISPFFSKGVEKHTWTIWLSSFPSLNMVVIVCQLVSILRP